MNNFQELRVNHLNLVEIQLSKGQLTNLIALSHLYCFYIQLIWQKSTLNQNQQSLEQNSINTLNQQLITYHYNQQPYPQNKHMNQYNLSDSPNRFQMAQHYHSSLQQPNLDNVQAKLYALRQKNHEMAKNYFSQKYGSSNSYEQFLQSSNMIDLVPPVLPTSDFRKQLQQKARQIQKQELSKLRKSSQNTGKKKSKANPWVNQQVENSRPNIVKSRKYQANQADEYEHNQQPEIEEMIINAKQNTNKNRQQSQFISQFKQYMSNKKSGSGQTLAEANKNQPQLQKNHQNRSNMKNKKDLSLSMSKSKIKPSQVQANIKKSTTTVPQEQLVKKIFKTIRGHYPNLQSQSQADYIQKIELIEYLTQNLRICQVLGIQTKDVGQIVTSQLQTKDPNKIKFLQCLLFFYKLLNNEQELKKVLARQQFSQIPQGCMLSIEVIKMFQNIFKKLDRHSDLIVKRLQFIQKLALDPFIKKYLNLPAVFQQHLNKSISLRRIFQRIQIEALLNQESEKANQYVSWTQFMRYFRSGHAQRGKYEIINLVESLKNEEKFGFNQIPDSVFQVICNCIKKSDKGEQYFNTQELISQIITSKIYEIQKYTFVRGRTGGSNKKPEDLPMQTFEQVLTRIKQNGHKYMNVKQFLQYFSHRGKPTQQIQQENIKKQKQANQPSKVTFTQNKMFQNLNRDHEHQIEGYDSDPQMYNNSNIFKKSNLNKKAQGILRQTVKSFNMSKLSVQQPSRKLQKNTKQLKVTVPQPFEFEERQKQRKQERLNRSMSQSKNIGFQAVQKFRAKQIPQKVKQIGLYQKIIQQNQKKIQDRKKCSMLLTLANEQPFSFLNRKTNKKTKQERQAFQFKANPIPWYCAVDLLQKKSQKQINRNQKIARMAQQSLAKAKLPPRMEKDYQQKIARKNLQLSDKKLENEGHIIKAKQPPNFQQIHKRFQLAMERKRKQNKRTEIKEFKFSVPKRQKKIIQQSDEAPKRQSLNKGPSVIKSSIDIFASSTLKFNQQVQKRRKQMDEKLQKEQQKQKQQAQRQKVNEQLKKKLLKASTNKQNKQKQSEQQRKVQQKKQNDQFKQWKNNVMQRAKQQPLLVQRPLKRDQKIEKMTKLHQISQTLKKNGIKGKQHDAYFKKDQLILIQDYQVLKNMLPVKK